MAVVNIIAERLKNNIESLQLPAILKTAFKKLKNLFTKIKTEEREIKPEVIKNAEHSVQTEGTSSASGEGREEQ